MSLIFDYAFQIATVILAAAALLSAERAIRISKHAVNFTRDSNLISLRLKVREALADAESSFLRLQADCQRAKGEWEAHDRKHLPPLSSNFFDRPEVERVRKLEHQGAVLLRGLREEAPLEKRDDETKFEQFIGVAASKSLEIQRLCLQLEASRSFPN